MPPPPPPAPPSPAPSPPPSPAGPDDLEEIFRPLVAASAWVVGQLGQSLDGRIATASGHSHYVTGPDDIRRLHRLRALSDAVIVGAGTVASDNARLTVREVPGPNPVRVVLDPRGRLDPGHHVFQVPDAPTLWVQLAGREPGEARRAGPENPQAAGRATASAADAGVGSHVELVTVPGDTSGRMDPAGILLLLRERGIHRVLVEGGGVTVSRFLAAGLLDRLHLVVAPLLIGSGRPGISLPVVETLEAALRPRTRIFRLGPDVLFDLEFEGRA
jgi:diaminohydroxyphosphoribosylaminopyrimidine deaminase / 5-amino-6-(5-phosphoribosylamino)uracil reductase